MEQKCEVANTEYDLLHQEMCEKKINSERISDTLRAVLEETNIRIMELKKDAYEFKRDIVVGGENMRTGKTIAEKMTRYMEDKLCRRDSLIEKLRLKNATVKSQLQRVETQLQQKEEMGDVLHYIDFHQLQIENKQYQSRIEERNDDLMRLKMSTGKTISTLNFVKHELRSSVKEFDSLNNQIAGRLVQLKSVQCDCNKIAVCVQGEDQLTDRLRCQLTEVKSKPTTLDFVEQKVVSLIPWIMCTAGQIVCMEGASQEMGTENGDG